MVGSGTPHTCEHLVPTQNNVTSARKARGRLCDPITSTDGLGEKRDTEELGLELPKKQWGGDSGSALSTHSLGMGKSGVTVPRNGSKRSLTGGSQKGLPAAEQEAKTPHSARLPGPALTQLSPPHAGEEAETPPLLRG